MSNYEKPSIVINDDLYEGVYAASGTQTPDSSVGKCNSLYMNGIFTVGTHQPITDGYKVGKGCEGCPYNWGRCAVNDPNAQPGQDGRPSWEKDGKLPDQKGY